MRFPFTRTMMLASASAVLIGGTAHAQQVDEIVVTAQKRSQDVQDVGISVAAFGAEQLAKMGVSTADKIADSVAGVQIYNYRGKSQPSFIIRGVGTQDFAPNTAPTAAVYVDEVYLGSNIVTGFSIFDVERVEVLKGPQGTLFGRNTTGGAVSYTSQRPSDTLKGYAEIGYGNYETIEAKFGIGGPIAEGFRARLAGTFSDQGKGIYTNTFTPNQNPFGPFPNFQRTKSNIGEDQTWALRLTTELDLSADAMLTFNVHGGKRKSDTLPVTPIGFANKPGAPAPCGLSATGGNYSDPALCADAFGYSDQDGDPFTVSNDYVGYNRDSTLGGLCASTGIWAGSTSPLSPPTRARTNISRLTRTGRHLRCSATAMTSPSTSSARNCASIRVRRAVSTGSPAFITATTRSPRCSAATLTRWLV